MTRNSVKPAKPTALNLSREMKLLLVLLLMVALVGGWYVWTSGRSADTLAQTPSATPTSDPPTQPTAPASQAEAAQGTGTDVNAVQPAGQVEVPSLPAFGQVDSGATSTPAEETPPIPGGINPDTPLAALPTVNPFRPLSVVTDGAGAGTASAPVTAQAPVTPAGSRLPGNEAASPVVRVPESRDTGALAISPIPGTGRPTSVNTPSVTGGAFPTPTLPGASSSVPRTEPVTLTPPRPTLPTATVPVTRPATRPGTPAGAAPTGRPATPTPSAPMQPPVAGVSVPQGNLDLNGLLGRAPAGNSTTDAAGTPTPAGTAGGQTVTALPTPGTPQPITQLGADSAAPATGTAAATNPLDRLVQSRDLAFNAAVLGPVNTAIFHGQDGFLVVSVGQTLPDSDVVVREVTATSVTLALGNDTKTLELDKR
ncbi:hypothetical protein Dcar01_01338 [Deinococcus carri]|uniref:Uncharacterized protein n=1 Tax=Deinococcus carri TaxID=1211323 RepID=A0ABP9W6A8_9DEIO